MTGINKAQLANDLPANISLLSSLIARKPVTHTSEWASTVDDAFSLYTRTSTINLLVAQSQSLAILNWPFPAYLDLKRELSPVAMDWQATLHSLDSVVRKPRLWWKFRRREFSFAWLSLFHAFAPLPQHADAIFSWWMVQLFRRDAQAIFAYWKSSSILTPKIPMIRDIERTYRRGYWAACLPTALPLLDFLIRSYFGTNRLDVTFLTLQNAFAKANVLPSDLQPGSVFLENYPKNRLATRLEDDLRLPGVLLYSFLKFANDYYRFYKHDVNASQVLNRHAILHCATDYWTRENATKLLTFLDLALRLRRPLEVIIHGAAAPWLIEHRANVASGKSQ